MTPYDSAPGIRADIYTLLKKLAPTDSEILQTLRDYARDHR